MVHWLVYHAHHQVLICTIHGHAILNVASHLADKHKDVDRKSRRAIVTDCLGLQLSQPSNADFRYGPRNPTPAIDGLAVQKGFACEDCGFLTTSWKKLRVHQGWTDFPFGAGMTFSHFLSKRYIKVRIRNIREPAIVSKSPITEFPNSKWLL